MGAQQLSESVVVLEDKLTFQTAYITGLVLAVVAVIVYFTFPVFQLSELSMWFGALFIIGDVFFVLSARKITITLDKNARTMTVLKFSVVGKKVFQIPFSKIKRLGLKAEGAEKKMNIPVLQFHLDDGTVLNYDYVLDESYDASVLSKFLGVPYGKDSDEFAPKKWIGFFESSKD